jgi:hypothetical protein
LKTKLVAAIAAALLSIGVATPAHADPTMHPDVAYAIDAVPGGTIVDEYTVVWPQLGMELRVAPVSARAVGSCATGQYCAYSQADRGGTKLSWTTCTTVSTAALASVKSIANARSSGKVQARNAAATVLATATAGTSTNVFGQVSSLRCAA